MAFPANRAALVAMATHLGGLPAAKNPHHNVALHPALPPQARANLIAIQSDPALSALATSSGSATDPTGGTKEKVRQGGDLGWGAGTSHIRQRNVRHLLLGCGSLVLAANASNIAFEATPKVDFKPDRLISMPGVTGTIAQIESGIRPQYVATTGEDLDMYQPLSYGGELDLDAVKAAVTISGFISNGNATASQTWYGAFVGEAVGQSYRAYTSKLQTGSLGTSGAVAAAGTGTLTLTPQIEYTPRKILLTPGTFLSDAFVITSITCGIQNQLLSADPIPASVFNDLFPLFLDLDLIKTAVALSIAYTNVSASSSVLKGSTRGDCDPQDLVRFGGMVSDVAS